MKKDNFDLKAYLIENKMTLNSRGEGRRHLGETLLDTRLLSEMKMKADPGDADVNLEEVDPYDHHDPEYDEEYAAGEGADVFDNYADAQRDSDIESECTLEEKGYTDTEEDFDDFDDTDLTLANILRGDKKAKQAAKAAAADMDPEDDSDLDEPAPDVPVDGDEEAAGEVDPNAETQYGLASQIQVPDTVEMMMDDAELDEYLSQFRRPQTAVNVLNRAIRVAQDEVNDSPGLKSLYIILKNGFYETSRFKQGQVIAKVNRAI